MADAVDTDRLGASVLPQIDDLRPVSPGVAAAVAQAAGDEGMARVGRADWAVAVDQAMWSPEYGPVSAA